MIDDVFEGKIGYLILFITINSRYSFPYFYVIVQTFKVINQNF